MNRWMFATLGKLALLLIGFAVLVELLAQASWSLTRGVNRALPRARHSYVWPPEPKATHQISEWHKDKGRAFGESPTLAQAVERGDLPPVEQRLPQDPLVIIPPDQFGPHLYGGQWQRLVKNELDVGAVMSGRMGFEGLVRWDAMGHRILPNLLRRWQVSADGKRITFWLRQGICWSDGHPYTVNDFAFWLEDVLLCDEIMSPGLIPRVFRPGGELFKFDRHNDYTFSLTFKQRNSLFFVLAASQRAELPGLPAHYLKQFHPRHVDHRRLQKLASEAGFSTWRALFDDMRSWRNPNLPRLSAWTIRQRPQPGRNIIFTRNPYYWKVDPEGNQLPYFDTIAFDLSDREMVNMKAMSGDAGLEFRALDFDQLPMYLRNQQAGPPDKHFRVLRWISGWSNAMSITPNMQHPDPVMRRLFHSRNFRIAFSLAINRPEINDLVYFGHGQPHQVAPLPTSEFYVPEHAQIYTAHNPVESNRLLDELGLTERDRDGMRLRLDGKPLVINFDVIDARSGLPVIQLIKSHLAEVGIRIRINHIARTLGYVRRSSGNYDVILGKRVQGGQAPLASPDDFVPVSTISMFEEWGRYYVTDGMAGIEPPELVKQAQAYWTQITQTMDRAKQRNLFLRITQLNAQNLWRIGVVGALPTLVVVNQRFVNVPEVAVESYIFHTLANVAPECFALCSP